MHDFRAFAPAGSTHGDTESSRATGLGVSALTEAPHSLAEHLRAICAPYHGVTLIVTDGLARIAASHPDGLEITLSSVGDEWLLALGPWHDEFSSLDTALAYVRMAVTGALRVKIEASRGRPRRWVVQRRAADGAWFDETDMTAPSLWRWGALTATYRQNRFQPRAGQLAGHPAA